MTTDEPDDQLLPELPPEVVERIVGELPTRGEKVIGCLRTAAVLIKQAVDDDRGLRLAESAGYNLREALDAVVAGRSPVSGGLPAILEAWDRYQSEANQPGADRAASLQAVEDALQRVAENRDRSSYHAARLLDYLRAKTGVDPLPGDLDPIGEYTRLRKDANTALHSEFALDAVTALYDRAVGWFIRMFTPPDALIHALGELAIEPWRGQEQVDRLRELATNQHHLKLFFGRLADPAWLMPLYESRIMQLPQPTVLWPAAGLLDGLGRTSPAEVAGLLERMLADSRGLPREQQHVGARFELLRVASQLGAAGHPVVAGVTAHHPDNQAVRALGLGVVKRADPADPVVKQIADAVLSGKPLDGDHYYVGAVLDQLEAGLNAGNVVERTRMLAEKVRRVVRDPDMRFIALDIARLTAELGDERHYVVIVTHHLVRLLSRSRELGVATSELLAWTDEIPGEIGERVTCRILAEADDVPLQDKINHIKLRLSSSTATGDDRDLVANVLSTEPESGMLGSWAEALGTPSAAPSDPRARPPEDWARAWRWSLVLPEDVHALWHEPIAQITARYGPPNPEALDHRLELPQMLTGQSAHSENELAGLPVLQAAELVASWRPDATSDRNLIGARELARTLEAVVKEDPDGWSTDPTAVVTALREPVYVLHYLRALTDKAAATAPRASMVLDAAELARTARWEPTILGRDDFDFEPSWHNVDTAAVDLAAALANNDANLAGHLDMAWTWALDLVDRIPNTDDSDRPFDGHDALARAINNPKGRALQAMLALAGWELRNNGAIRPDFTQVLNDVVRIPGRIGMEYRAILAERRVFLEAVAPSWLEKNATTLFSDNELGRETFDLTLKYARPTRWFYRHFRDELIAAARRRVNHAVAWLLIGALNEEDGYALDAIIDGLRGDTAALASAAKEMAFLLQSSEADNPHLTIAVEFWRALVEADRRVVPADALRSSGRWAFVTGLSDAVWSQLTIQTLELTGGTIDLPIEVADRCKIAHASGNSTRILLLLLGQGEPWERDYVARTAIETLRTVIQGPVDENFQRLRTRLIELGHHEAAEVRPDEGRDDD
ncbi:MAG: hypothetical protein ACRDRY_06265 [Pseudonocardiaceae bacterium]